MVSKAAKNVTRSFASYLVIKYKAWIQRRLKSLTSTRWSKAAAPCLWLVYKMQENEVRIECVSKGNRITFKTVPEFSFSDLKPAKRKTKKKNYCCRFLTSSCYSTYPIKLILVFPSCLLIMIYYHLSKWKLEVVKILKNQS